MADEAPSDSHIFKGPIAWMAQNHVAANLLMLFFLVGGFFFILQIQQEIFPVIELDVVRVSVRYPGAGPAEVEQGIILAIEEQVRSLDGVKRVTSTALENLGVVNIELILGEDQEKLLQDVKNAVDSIQSFPKDAEKPIVSLLKPRRQVISLIVYGNQDIRTVRDVAEQIRDQVLNLPGITLVDVTAVPPYLVAIEVPLEILRNYHLTLGKIASVIKDSALELPGGSVRTASGQVLLRTQERRDYARQYYDIPIIANPDGSNVFLGDIATLKDTFETTDQEAFFNGLPAVKIDIFRVGDQKPIEISTTIEDYVKELKSKLPEGMNIVTWNDRAQQYKDRIGLLIGNAQLGIILVFLLLSLFLEPRLAFWVTMGIPTSIMGSFIVIALVGASLNMVSLFAFIVTLGIVVDDAIMVGENIYQNREKGLTHLKASVLGTKEIAGPVFFAVLTNIIAFTPLLFVPGSTGKIFFQIPAVVIAVFSISLIESLFIIPAHLSKENEKSKIITILSVPSHYMNNYVRIYINTYFHRQIHACLKHRYLTVSTALAVLIIFLGLIVGGYVTFSYLPRVDSDLVSAQITLPYGVPISESRKVEKQLVQAAQQTIKESGGEKISKGIFGQIGTQLGALGPSSEGFVTTSGSHIVGAQILLVPLDQRDVSGLEVSKKWQQNLGVIPGVESESFDATIVRGSGLPINVELSHPDGKILEAVTKEVAKALENYHGVSQIDDSISKGKPQITFKIKPSARSTGLTSGDLARDVRSSFYGAEALRQQRGRHEVKVLVRLPKEDRESLESVEKLIINTPKGGEIPFVEAVDLKRDRAYTDIKRDNGRRVLVVTADVDEEKGNANQIIADLEKNVLSGLMERYPDLRYSLEGEQRAQNESLDYMIKGFIVALIAIYAVLAIPFKSYTQPLVVMISIPFGIVGAVFGHILLGYELSIISMFGLIALSGIVVNDSLVLLVTTNQLRSKELLPPIEALSLAAKQRFRPIMLTSLTTFLGLSPMIFEKSAQARFLVPMAISLGFGVIFATFITLLIVPAIYLILEDMKEQFTKKHHTMYD